MNARYTEVVNGSNFTRTPQAKFKITEQQFHIILKRGSIHAIRHRL